MKRYCLLSVLLWTLFQLSDAQQLTRKQLGQKFYQATQYHENGQDSMAISVLEEVATMLPNLALTYRREAEIFDDMSEQGNPEALNGAVLMYRKYLTLELDSKKTADAEKRLRALEDQLQIGHFDDQQRIQAKEEEKQNVVLASLDEDDDNLDAFVMSVSKRTKAVISKGTKAIIPKPDKTNNSNAVEAPSRQANEASGNATIPAEVATTQAVGPSGNNAASKGNSSLSYLKYFNIQIPARGVAAAEAEKPIVPSELLGHWVSSETTTNGREYWIFDVSPFSSTLNFTLSNEAGVISIDSEELDWSDKLMSLLREQEFVAHTTQMEISDHMATATIDNDHLIFTLEGSKEYVPHSNVYYWTKQVLENISTVIPFGSLFAKLGESVTSSLSKKDQAATYKIVMRFDCTLNSSGNLRCAMQKKTTVTTEKKSKTSTEVSNFILYHTKQTYSHFMPDLKPLDPMSIESLLKEVSEKAQTDNKYAYALGLFYHYGVGVEKNEQEAVAYMTLATQSDIAPKAMSWLAIFYNKEAENASSLSFMTRRKYHKMSNLWLNKMREQNMQEWYGVKADLLAMKEDEKMQDSVRIYYQKGALAGDAYCNYKLASILSATKNYKEAADKLNLAANMGYADALCDLAVLKRQGYLGAVDYDGYLDNLTKALEQGSDKALLELSNAYHNGYGVSIDFSKGNAIRNDWYNAIQNQWMKDISILGFKYIK